MNNKILLSIVIPTYNRASFLETTVGCFTSQIKKDGLESEVEVIIANDASKDATSALVDRIDAQYGFVRGFNHPQNLGFSGNVEFLMKKAEGEYVVICGDDDLVRDGAIVRILKYIKEKGPNFILMNTTNMVSLDNANIDIKITQENRLNIFEDIFVENFQRDHELLKPAHNWLYLTNFITANVFRKDLFESELAAARKHVRAENAYAFQGQIIIGIAKHGRLLVISEPLVLHRKTEPNWTADAEGIFIIDIFDSVEISRLIKEYIPGEYKKYKKLLAAFVIDDFILEIKKRMEVLNIRKYALIAFWKNIDCFPENIKLLSITIAPKLVAYVAPKLQTYKKLIKINQS